MKKPVDIYSLTDAQDTRASADACAGIAESAALLKDLLDSARAIQWQSPLPFTMTVSGQPPRPVEDAALNPKRMLVRVKVVAAERVLAAAQRSIAEATEELEEAVLAYEES